VLGPEHPDTLSRMSDLALVYHEQKKDDEADNLYIEVLDLSKQKLGSEHPDTIHYMFEYAIFLKEQNREAEAFQFMEQAVEMSIKIFGESNVHTQHRKDTLAAWRRDLSRPSNDQEVAESIYHECDGGGQVTDMDR
jgi:hypothetical protein